MGRCLWSGSNHHEGCCLRINHETTTKGVAGIMQRKADKIFYAGVSVFLMSVVLVALLLLMPVKQVDSLHDRPSLLERWQASLWLEIADFAYQLQDYPVAVDGYRKGFVVSWNDPAVMQQFAESLIIANDGKVSDEADMVVQLLLSLEPDNPEGLWMAAVSETQAGNRSQAMAYLSQLLLQLPAASSEAEHVQRKLLELATAEDLSKHVSLDISAE